MRRILLVAMVALGSIAVPASAAAEDEIAAEINVGCFGGGGTFESNGVVGDLLCAKVVVNFGGPWVPSLETNHINVHLTFDLTADDGSTARVLVTTKWTGDVLPEILAGGTVTLEGRGHVIKASGSLAGLDDDGGQFDAVGLVDYGSGKANWSFTHAVD